MEGVWDFLSSPENRETIAWIGSGVCVALSGLWVVVKHLGARSAPAAQPEAPHQVSNRNGIAAAGNLSVRGDIRIGDVALPRLALALAALGMILLAVALMVGRGDTITGSVTSGGDITGSTISIGGAVPPPKP